MKTFYLTIFFLFVSSAIAGPEDEEFFVFDVGQGNCQLVIYHQAKLGFLFDSGSSSRKKHPKLTGLTQNDYAPPFFKRGEPQAEEATEELLDDLGDLAISEEMPDEITQFSGVFRERSSSTVSLEKSHSIEGLEKAIKKTIEDKKLECLCVFLSHPDKDHINLITEKVIPANLNVIAYLGGDFLGTENETEVDKVLGFLNVRDKTKTWVEFPFYWGWNYQKGDLKTYVELRDYFSTHNSADEFWKKNKDLIKTLSLSGYNPEVFFQGTGEELLSKTREINGGFDAFLSDFTDPHLTIFREQSYVWGMNHRYYDVNAQSTVISFKLPENQIVLTCTGDAEDLTFKRISSDLELFPSFEGYDSILMVPHHGSKNNTSQTMIDLFHPEIFIISAGNGKQYGHPDLETITWLRSIEAAPKSTSSWDLSGSEVLLIAFDRDDGKKPYLKRSVKEGSLPIFSTNVMGTIRFTNQSFSSLFNNVFEVDEKYYEVDFSKNIMPEEPLDEVEESGCFYRERKEGGNLYYKVQSGATDLYYLMEEKIQIEED